MSKRSATVVRSVAMASAGRGLGSVNLRSSSPRVTLTVSALPAHRTPPFSVVCSRFVSSWTEQQTALPAQRQPRSLWFAQIPQWAKPRKWHQHHKPQHRSCSLAAMLTVHQWAKLRKWPPVNCTARPALAAHCHRAPRCVCATVPKEQGLRPEPEQTGPQVAAQRCLF